MQKPQRLRKRYSLGEEIFNAITHGVGSMLSIAGMVVLLVFAALGGDPLTITSCAVYGASLIVLYTMSTLYHSITNKRAKAFFRIMDHNTIF
ncbi:MAG: hemolysin III family protein, partial [Oscillospiraceae bacterium]|nr:hemolysin III family protein [Oscillospiraceae bacterium]